MLDRSVDGVRGNSPPAPDGPMARRDGDRVPGSDASTSFGPFIP